ncbi:MAG: ABC transporter permease, partial [Pseudomonadota bacterium]
ANRQYMLINLVVPLLLALLTALISHGGWGRDYVFAENRNIATYFFISVVVALFLGLSVSAEEIHRDRKVLERERFLLLSWPCYVAAKTAYLVLAAALQMTLFVLVGNAILRIPDMHVFTWLTLFSCAVCSSILGLNISASFRSAVAIYILIPLILVPQMMLGGAVVPFDELMHHESGTRATPLMADLMPSRWGYEALVVEQYKENRYMRPIFEDFCTDIQADYMTDLHIPEVRALADYPLLEEGRANPSESARRLRALKNEMALLERRTGVVMDIPAADLDVARYDPTIKAAVKELLKAAAAYVQAQGRKASDRVLATNDTLRKELGHEGFEAFKDRHYNKDISHLALNALTLEAVRLSGERLVQVAAPACQPVEKTFGAHFLATAKRLGPWTLPTQLVDLTVLWLMSVLLFLSLNFSLLPRLMSLVGKLGKRK